MMRRSTVARLAGGALSLIALTLFAGCHDSSQDASRENFTAAVNGFLAQHGHLCLAKYDWPIYVTTDDRASGTRDAIQMPVLEKLALVTGKDMQVERADTDGKKITAMARQYQLTHEGQKYYLHMPEVVATATSRVTHPADFCAATLTLDKVVGWEKPMQLNGKTVTSVVYTYRIDPAPWAKDADAQRVFPMIKRVIEGAGTMQLREGVHLTADGWVADEVFQR
ncbi:hypothetical protein QYH69_26025 [Paraburkholderia sp. SARCC-3016]|uniref:hypothetical protein n=1 Tax=Paraburkholderia sp. SARCC-3016 TaxID=3058611 RepID=UPI00280990BE|nr:hypothetical protein [Paraburkholderia sp. SARCC-3016]MDQ7980701.1 hypothetical protein [Paraburkholderia sp. SARCC-3016]